MTASPHIAKAFVVPQFERKNAQPVAAAVTRPLVFVSVGMDHHPFDRLVRWVDCWAREHPEVEVVVQHGAAASPSCAQAVRYLSHHELFSQISRARVVVSHGGPATIAEARHAGLIPLVAPRGHALGEHVDNHQQAFAALLAARDEVFLVQTETDLVEALNRALAEPEWLRRESGRSLDVAASIRNFAAVVDSVTSRSSRTSAGGRASRSFRR